MLVLKKFSCVWTNLFLASFNYLSLSISRYGRLSKQQGVFSIFFLDYFMKTFLIAKLLKLIEDLPVS